MLQDPFLRTRFVACIVLMFVLAGSGPSAHAASENVGPAGNANDEVLIELNLAPSDDTGMRFRNLSNQSGTVSIEYSTGPLPTEQTSGSPYPTSFRMIDNTMLSINTSAFPDGEKLLRTRMEFDQQRVAQRGLRTHTLHLMKLSPNGQRWAPAAFSIRNTTRSQFRFLPDSPADFVLGHFGIDQQNGYVWAVIDDNGTYGIAGVPEPAALSLIAAAGMTLLLRRPNRRVAAVQ